MAYLGLTLLTQLLTHLWVWLTRLTQGDTLKAAALVSPEEAPNTNVMV